MLLGPLTGQWLIALGTAAIVYATLLPNATSVTTAPFCLVCGPLGGVDVILNLLLFAPLGFGLALRRIRPISAMAILCSFTVAIELLQWRWIPGRDASLSDVVTNSTGGLVAFWIGRRSDGLLLPGGSLAARLAVAWTALWTGLLAIVAFALVPVLPETPYFGQLARPATSWRDAFPGTVVAAHVGAEEVLPGRLTNAADIRALLRSRSGAVAEVRVVPGGATIGRGEMMVISGPRDVAVLSLEQLARGFVFGVRTGAEILRLRPVEFILPDVVAGSGSDTIRLRGQYGHQRVTLSALSRTDTVTRSIVPRLSMGWRIFWPRSSYISGRPGEHVIGVLFLGLILLPAGYWMRFSAASSRPHAAATAFATVVLLTMFALPAIFGLRAAAWWEWAATAAGAGAGAALGQLARSLARARNRSP